MELKPMPLFCASRTPFSAAKLVVVFSGEPFDEQQIKARLALLDARLDSFKGVAEEAKNVLDCAFKWLFLRLKPRVLHNSRLNVYPTRL